MIIKYISFPQPTIKLRIFITTQGLKQRKAKQNKISEEKTKINKQQLTRTLVIAII